MVLAARGDHVWLRVQGVPRPTDIPGVSPNDGDAANHRTVRALEAQLEERERQLYETQAKYDALLSQLPAAIYVDSPDPSGPTYYVSPQIRDMLGISPAEYIGRQDIWDTLVHPDDRERMAREYEEFIRTGQPEHGDYRYLKPDGTVVWIHDRSKLVLDQDGRRMFVQGVMFDVTAQKEAELALQHMAYHDTLTGLPNRAMFEQHLDLALARARRSERSVAVLFMDLDGFKEVNDAMGHSAGDELLCAVAERLRRATRETDLVARLGGDEFLVLLADLPDERGQSPDEVVRTVAGRITDGMLEPFPLRGTSVETSISVGSCQFPVEAQDAETLMSVADAAMYAQKRRGGGARLVDSA
jgi:diguanylate cyclase (GGDEF)-like protein/PAS domain S-box-containing protein